MALENPTKKQIIVHCFGSDLSDFWILELDEAISFWASSLHDKHITFLDRQTFTASTSPNCEK